MTLAPLSFAALPAIPGLANKALRTGAQAGNQFLSLLSSVASPAPSTSTPNAPSPTASSGNPDPLSARTLEWSQRFLSWLRQQGVVEDAAQPLAVQLSLDHQDQPHAVVNGETSTAVDLALAQNPSWLQEFRDLALDRLQDMSGLASAATASMSLTIQAQSDTIVPKVGWN